MKTAYLFFTLKTINMAKNDIEGSQQQGQGITIGTQGNNDMVIPGPATHGSHDSKQGKDDRSIPNQDRSSATNMNNEDSNKEQGQ
jgi:hypothetical protein